MRIGEDWITRNALLKQSLFQKVYISGRPLQLAFHTENTRLNIAEKEDLLDHTASHAFSDFEECQGRSKSRPVDKHEVEGFTRRIASGA
jgi:hypothetical protein